jgi:hypothetical protein
MARLDIPFDGTTPHCAAITFVQDTETDEFGTLTGEGYYEAFGTSSMTWTDPVNPFTWLSNPGVFGGFTAGTLPSLAVNGLSGNRISVTYFAAQDNQTDWQAWATLWRTDLNIVSAPTQVDTFAQGESNFDLSFFYHDWGTASSITMTDPNSDFYWAAWSDKIGTVEPCRVFGSVGFANP